MRNEAHAPLRRRVRFVGACYGVKREISTCDLVRGCAYFSVVFIYQPLSGGGIGGLTLAAVLHKYCKEDIQIDMYEAKDKFAEIGAGISLWRGPWAIMQLLGFDKALEKVVGGPPDEKPRTLSPAASHVRLLILS